MNKSFRHLCAEALFASWLQESQHPDPDAVRAAVMASVKRLRMDGIAPVVAAEFGDHPEEAVVRMTWCLHAVDDMAAAMRHVDMVGV